MDENEQYREHLLKTIIRANKYFDYYRNLSPEEQKIYEQEINYKRDKIKLDGNRSKLETYIYLMYDPTTISKTCYVGWSYSLEKRLKKHKEANNSLAKANHKKNWIKSLKKRGVKPLMLILDIIEPLGWWQLYETFYIAYYKSINIKLCNSTLGGEGSCGYEVSTETRQKMRDKKLGIAMSEENKIARMRQDLLENIDLIKHMYIDY